MPFYKLIRLDDDDEEHSYFGKKYIGVGQGGTLEIFGEKKLAWTFLNKTLHPEKSNQKSYLFHRSWGNRGIILHVIDPTTGDVLHSDRWGYIHLHSSLNQWRVVLSSFKRILSLSWRAMRTNVSLAAWTFPLSLKQKIFVWILLSFNINNLTLSGGHILSWRVWRLMEDPNAEQWRCTLNIKKCWKQLNLQKNS